MTIEQMFEEKKTGPRLRQEYLLLIDLLKRHPEGILIDQAAKVLGEYNEVARRRLKVLRAYGFCTVSYIRCQKHRYRKMAKYRPLEA
jgi:predicted ArsR family transcriptional regulator